MSVAVHISAELLEQIWHVLWRGWHELSRARVELTASDPVLGVAEETSEVRCPGVVHEPLMDRQEIRDGARRALRRLPDRKVHCFDVAQYRPRGGVIHLQAGGRSRLCPCEPTPAGLKPLDARRSY